jgi:hypothetical protein
VVVALGVVAIRSVLFYWLCIRNSKKLYEKMFACVRDARIRFFEINPLGALLLFIIDFICNYYLFFIYR